MTIINGVRAKYVTAITGGGTAAVSNILSQGGASSWFLEGLIPYSKEALTSFLGSEPEKCVSERAANQMALKAYMRAISLGTDYKEAAGLGCTAVLGKVENERAGREHFACVSVQLYNALYHFHLNIPRSIDLFGRESQEHYIANKIKRIIMTDNIESCTPDKTNTDNYGLLSLLLSNKRLANSFDLWNGQYIPLPYICKNEPFVVYSGSFDPFHEGHAVVINKLGQKTGKPVWLEVSIRNVDKPDIDLAGLDDRMNSIHRGVRLHNLKQVEGVILTNTPKFYDKLSLLGPNASFVVGSDTASRMVDRKYGKVEELFDLVEVYGTNIYVCNRPGYDFVAPKQYKERFIFLEGQGISISSTEKRKGA